MIVNVYQAIGKEQLSKDTVSQLLAVLTDN